MPETIANGSFTNGLANWTTSGPGTVSHDVQIGNGVGFNTQNSAVGGIITQTVDVTPNEDATFTMRWGKIGTGATSARVTVQITYLDGSGNEIILFTETQSDTEGRVFTQRDPTDLDQTITGSFTIPDGVTQVSVRIIDATPSTTAIDLYVDDISLDVTCYCAGSLIETPSGPMPVEDLCIGDLVATRDHGPQPIRWIGKRALAARGKFSPIKIPAGALGNGLPERDLLVSRQHRILVRSPAVANIYDCREALIPAIKLVGRAGISVVENMQTVTYCHLLLDHHEIIYAEGCASESLYLGPQALKTMSADSLEEIYAIFPALKSAGFQIEPACLMPSPHECKRLMQRHEPSRPLQ